MNHLLGKLAGLIAAQVADEVIKRLPDITDVIIEALPSIIEAAIDQILGHLLPFKRP